MGVVEGGTTDVSVVGDASGDRRSHAWRKLEEAGEASAQPTKVHNEGSGGNRLTCNIYTPVVYANVVRLGGSV